MTGPALNLVPIRKQGAWGLWWLCVITFGIYYLVWYHRINRELAAFVREDHAAWGRWWSQIIPFYGLYGLSKTAKRLNDAHAMIGSPTRVSPVMTWLWSGLWFASTPRYVQRRINTLADIQASHQVTRPAAA
ncbi:DUF4234 domain-containing protein [Gordonia sp. NPDC062954]|uniref:DUF4234 domain-containing protein n=1 Tax=unclassified Gordonia (in: high G+C Gram-positive bacteria) TaxID=2657482 RepID=UPI000C696431|nr:DUF4234 domain-containing protein [Gordonia sp. (in: high G+C Gram-positive bacteria)]MAU83402.1 hypothetical protein [Gordonia sp. (in: high G+C Gram-positive bacteria)]